MTDRDWSDGEHVYHERDGLTTTVEKIDIVERLRAKAIEYPPAPPLILLQAADEIERLRGALPMLWTPPTELFCEIISAAFRGLTNGMVGPRITVNEEQFDRLFKMGMEQVGDAILQCSGVQFIKKSK